MYSTEISLLSILCELYSFSRPPLGRNIRATIWMGEGKAFPWTEAVDSQANSIILSETSIWPKSAGKSWLSHHRKTVTKNPQNNSSRSFELPFSSPGEEFFSSDMLRIVLLLVLTKPPIASISSRCRMDTPSVAMADQRGTKRDLMLLMFFTRGALSVAAIARSRAVL